MGPRFPVMAEAGLLRGVLMWAVAIAVVNVAWALVVDGEAVRELNDADHPFQESVPIPIQGLLGAEGPLPAVFVAEFEHLADPTAEVGWAITSADGTMVARWNGTVQEGASGWEGTLPPGDYVLTSSGPDQVVAYMTLTLEPLGPMRVEGHLFATLGLIVIAFADRGIRRWLDSRESKGDGESIPIGFRGVRPLVDEDPVQVDGQWSPPVRG